MFNRVIRENYLNQLISFKDKDVIKVVSGIRRCGKSTLFDIYCDYLKQNGVDEKQIIKINLEDPKYYQIDNFMKLYNHIVELLSPDEMNYIFIDEVQNISEFQKAIDGLYIKDNCDVYITGSNAFLLSGELATLLSGRYVEIKMLPFSFNEYLSCFEDKTDIIKKYQNYIQFGSFPYITKLENPEDKLAYLDGIYSSIVLKDIIARNKISNVGVLESLIKFMFDNVGNLCSSTKIANTMTSNGMKVSYKTIDSYLNALTESFILYKATRYDIKGKQHLSTGAKYYLSDMGLRFYLLGAKPADHGHLLENIIYLELLRRGNKVYIGKCDNKEVDFYTIKNGENEYYQVAYSAIDENTLKRELSSLENIASHDAKYLITMDFIPKTSHNGIKQLNALDWLMNK
ncbi:MAG: ATP-binding protein [Bacillota bacterium]